MPATVEGTIGRFGLAELPAVAGFPAFRHAVLDPEGRDCVFHHAPDRSVDVVPHGLVRGQTVFGPGVSLSRDMNENPVHRLKGVSSVVLDRAVLSPDSMAVISPEWGFFNASIDNLEAWQGKLSIADRHFIEAGPDRWRHADPAATIPMIDAIALPIGGIGLANYGHFFYDGLPAAILHHRLLGGKTVLAGRPLRHWQAEVLDALGVLDGYVAIDRPTRFCKILTSDMVSWTVSYPNRLVRGLFDRLRFRFGSRLGTPRRVMISRTGPDNRRVLDNGAEIEAIAAEFGFTVVRPAGMSVADQARLFAGADCVIGESGAGMANLGFCDPGTRILEIQPASFVDGWTRAACHLLGLRWQVFFAPVTGEAGCAVSRDFRFTVDPAAFHDALAAVFGPR